MFVLSMVSAVAWAATAPSMGDSAPSLLGVMLEWGIVGPFVAAGAWLIRYLLRKNDEAHRSLLEVANKAILAEEKATVAIKQLTTFLMKAGKGGKG